MKEGLNQISAEELFGVASSLATYVEEAPISGIASLGPMYQLATGGVALLFIFILVRYYNIFGAIVASFFSKNENRTDFYSTSADLQNIKIFMSIAGLSLISLLAMRATAINEVHQLLPSVCNISVWMVGAIVFVATFLVILCERAALYLTGALCEQEKVCNGIWHVKLLYFSGTIVMLTPLLILALLTEGLTTKIALYASVTVCFISSILFIKDTFLLFRAQRFSIFHWILYLCALEIFPLSLLLAPILRG